MIRHVIWDWNGTLLDDLEESVATLNSILDDRGFARVTHDEYRARFGFPVRAFYEGLGFDFAREDYGALSETFIGRYRARAARMRLAAGALDVLATLRARGVRHHVVSAMETTLLGAMLAEHRVRPLVEGFHGRADLSAGSKIEHGAAAVRRLGLRPEELLVVGDTLHDRELADALGCRCALVAFGHQARERLAGAGVTVIEALAELTALFPRV